MAQFQRYFFRQPLKGERLFLYQIIEEIVTFPLSKEVSGHLNTRPIILLSAKMPLLSTTLNKIMWATFI